MPHAGIMQVVSHVQQSNALHRVATSTSTWRYVGEYNHSEVINDCTAPHSSAVTSQISNSQMQPQAPYQHHPLMIFHSAVLPTLQALHWLLGPLAHTHIHNHVPNQTTQPLWYSVPHLSSPAAQPCYLKAGARQLASSDHWQCQVVSKTPCPCLWMFPSKVQDMLRKHASPPQHRHVSGPIQSICTVLRMLAHVITSVITTNISLHKQKKLSPEA